MKITNIKVVEADKGKRLVDGTKGYPLAVLLPENRTPEEFSEITEAEYNEIEKAKELEYGAEIR